MLNFLKNAWCYIMEVLSVRDKQLEVKAELHNIISKLCLCFCLPSTGPWGEKEEWTAKFQRVIADRLENEGYALSMNWNMYYKSVQ